MPAQKRQPKKRVRGLPVNKVEFKGARLALNITQQQLADRAAVDVQTVRRGEAGKKLDEYEFHQLAEQLRRHPASLTTTPERLDPQGQAIHKARLETTIKIDGPEEMLKLLLHDEGAKKCFFLLISLGLIRDGVPHLRYQVGCIELTAELSLPDIRRLLDAHINGDLKWLDVVSVTVHQLYPQPLVIHPGYKSELIKAIDEMPPDDRDIILLSAVERLTDEEVAMQLTLPVSTIRNRKLRAIQRLNRASAKDVPPVPPKSYASKNLDPLFDLPASTRKWFIKQLKLKC